MIVYVVEGAGLISLHAMANGEMSVQHTGSSRVGDVVASVCRTPRCYWSTKYRHWVIREPHVREVLADFDAVALRISSSNLYLFRPAHYPALAFACDPGI